MKFHYSKAGLSGREQRRQRFFEMVPGIISWTILLSLIILALIRPIWAIIAIIAFDLYWFLRLIYMTIFLVLSFCRLGIESRNDWMDLVRAVDHLDQDLQTPKAAPRGLRERIARSIHQKELRALRAGGSPPPPSRDLIHLVILPVAKETAEILGPSIEGLRRQTFPAERIVVVIALEESAPDPIKAQLTGLREKYQGHFKEFLVILHPAGRPGEARVKGANVTWAAKQAAEYFTKHAIPFKDITVSCLDADTIVNPDYFACLTYYFLITPNRLQSSFQPIPVFHNNIWEAPGFARVIETGASFFQLIESTNPEQLVTFSSHSMSFQALVDVGYWPVDIISDDSAIFWKAFIHYDGRFSVVPMYTTVSMDITVADNIGETMRSVYKQKRRWAWGVENFPIVMRAFLRADRIPLGARTQHALKLLEGHISWATWGFILTVISWLPTLLAQRALARSVAYYNAPYVSSIIFNLASISLIISIILSIALLPKTRIRHSFWKKTLFALQWLMMPVILVIFSALPALDAQTRMLLGRRLEFWVADKRRSCPLHKTHQYR